LSPILFLLAFVHHGYIPVEIFGDAGGDNHNNDADDSELQRMEGLVRWGIVKVLPSKKKNKIGDKADLYAIPELADQVALHEYMTSFSRRPDYYEAAASDDRHVIPRRTLITDEGGWRKCAYTDVGTTCLRGAVRAAGKFRLVRAVRLLNLTMTLVWVAFKYLPQHQRRWTRLVGALNFVAALLAGALGIVAAAVLAIVWLLVTIVSWWVNASQLHRLLIATEMILHAIFYKLGLEIRAQVRQGLVVVASSHLAGRIGLFERAKLPRRYVPALELAVATAWMMHACFSAASPPPSPSAEEAVSVIDALRAFASNALDCVLILR